jgi:large subunit ribosomal protein L30
MSKIKITQVKSDIKRPQRQKDTLLALGLGKINRSNVLENNVQVQGMVAKVAHLINIEHLR